MKQDNAKMGEIETYPCREDLQQLLDQDGEPSTSANQFQDAWMDGGGVVLRVGVQMAKNDGV